MNEPTEDVKPAIRKKDILEFLQGERLNAFASQKAREQAAKCFMDGDDEAWARAAMLHPSTMHRPMKKAERNRAAVKEQMIAEKYRRKVELLTAAIERLEKS